jgi:Ribonuclease G/E
MPTWALSGTISPGGIYMVTVRDDEYLNSVALRLCKARDNTEVEVILSKEVDPDDVGIVLTKAAEHAQNVLFDEYKASWLKMIAATH